MGERNGVVDEGEEAATAVRAGAVAADSGVVWEGLEGGGGGEFGLLDTGCEDVVGVEEIQELGM